MKKLIKKYRLELSGALVGLAAGWSYWYFIGCASGTCAITSSPYNSALYGMLMGFLTFNLFRSKKQKQEIMKTVEEKIRAGTATIVDVRTPQEYLGGHVKGSFNIPLQELPGRLDEIRNMKNIVLCCASGNRSGQAAMYLKQQGIACDNGGSWMDVDNYYG